MREAEFADIQLRNLKTVPIVQAETSRRAIPRVGATYDAVQRTMQLGLQNVLEV